MCKLKKALYGLKQSARSWNQKIDYVLKSHGFKQSEADLCLYTKHCNGALLYVLLYVDDLLICGNAEMIKETADMLNEHFEIKDLGELNLYLGIQIGKTDRAIICSLKSARFNKSYQNLDLQMQTDVLHQCCRLFEYHWRRKLAPLK